MDAIEVDTGARVIAGEGVGIVTLDNAPGVAVVDLFVRATNQWIRRQVSTPEGKYRFTGLPAGVLHDVVGRDITDTWDDVIVGRVLPFAPVWIYGDAPAFGIGMPYSFSYSVGGGEPPYTFSLNGSLPAGLSLETTETSVAITGTPSAGAVDSSWQVVVTDARETEASVDDSARGGSPHRYWRINITNANTHCSIDEIEMADSVGSPDQCVGGSVITSGQWPDGGGYSHAATNAFNNSTGGVADSWASSAQYSGWIGYVFPWPVLVGEVRIFPRAVGSQSPRDFTIQWSDDGVAWTTVATVTGKTSWTAGVFTSFPI